MTQTSLELDTRAKSLAKDYFLNSITLAFLIIAKEL
jgi:hypothetical protein